MDVNQRVTQGVRCECGEPIAREITDRDVVTLSGATLTFRRHTDYVMCARCLSFFRARDLRAGYVTPLTFRELKLLHEVEAAGRPGPLRQAV